MEWIPQILQLPVIVDRRRLLSPDLQRLQELDFLFGGIAAQRRIAQESLQPGFQGHGLFRPFFRKLELLSDSCCEPAVQNNFNPKTLQVYIPRVDERIQERDAVFNRDVKDVRVQKFENGTAHLRIAARS